MQFEVPYVLFPFTPAPENAFHGDAGGPVLVIIRQEEWDQPELRELLVRIFKSVGLEAMNQRILVLREKEGFPFRLLSSSQSQKKFLIFGIDPDRLHLAISAKLYAEIKRKERSLFFVHPLAAFLSDRKWKMMLWELLKKHLV